MADGEMATQLRRIEKRVDGVMNGCAETEPYDEKIQVRKLLQVAGSKLISLLQAKRPSITSDGRIVTAEFTREEMDRINEVIGNLDEITLKVGCLLPMIPHGLKYNTSFLVRSMAQAVAEKLYAKQEKYPDEPWRISSPDQEERLQDMLIEHVKKGDPIDVIAIASMLWHHKWPTLRKDYLLNYGPSVVVLSLDDTMPADKWLEARLKKHFVSQQVAVAVECRKDTNDLVVRILYFPEKENYMVEASVSKFASEHDGMPKYPTREDWFKAILETLEAAHEREGIRLIKMSVMARLLTEKGGKVVNISIGHGALTLLWKCRDGSRNVCIPFVVPPPMEVGKCDEIGKTIYDEIMSQRGEYNTRRIKEMRRYFKGKRFLFLRGCPISNFHTKPTGYGGKIVNRIDRSSRGASHVVVPPPNHRMRTKSGQTVATEEKIKKAEMLGIKVLTWQEYKKLCR